MPRTPDRLITAAGLTDIAVRLGKGAPLLDQIRANIDDNLPGYPTSTPGAGHGANGWTPSDEDIDGIPLALDTRTGIGILTLTTLDTLQRRGDTKELARTDRLKASSTKPDTIVEKLALVGTPDEALAASEELEDIVTGIDRLVDRYIELGFKYGYQPRTGKGLVADGIHCVQHLKLHLERAIWHHGANHVLCHWCQDFVSEQGRRPSLALLQLKDLGTTITQQMRDDDRPARRIVAGRRKHTTRVHRCPRPKCKTDIPDTQFACRPHLLELPIAMRSRIAITRRRAALDDPEARTQLADLTQQALDHWRTNRA